MRGRIKPMIPLADSSRDSRSTAWVNITFITINVAAFLFTLLLGELDRNIAYFRLGVVPLEFTNPEIFTGIVERTTAVDVTPIVPSWVTLITSMFLHGGWAHILGNMVFLWVFGDALEGHFGHVGYAVFYLLGGIAASAAHIFFNWESLIPAVGASGAIAAVLGAYLLLFPRRRIRTLFMAGFITVMNVPALWLLIIWAVIQVFSGVGSLGSTATGGGVAYWAHVGGFIAGVGAIAVWRLLLRQSVWQPDRYDHNVLQTYDDDDDDYYDDYPPHRGPPWRR